jgi:hypothetical protein
MMSKREQATYHWHGDGGQNLIVTRALGVIRTQELIEARKIDGGEQFFQEQMILILKS